MRRNVNRLPALSMILLLSVTNIAMAAGPDLRLVNAAAQQDKAAVRALLKLRVDVNTPRADGSTALLWASHWDDIETVDVLLRAGANVNAADDHGVTPLAQACENADPALVEKLLTAGASANAGQTSGLTPLMIGAHTGNQVVVKTLLAHGANVNAMATQTKATALMWAVADRHTDIARLLIEGRADVHASSKKGFTPLLFAAVNGDVEMAKILLAAGVGVNEIGVDGDPALPISIISGQDGFALFLLEYGADPNAAIGGVRALHAAAGSVAPWLSDWNRKYGGGAVGGGGSGMGLSASRRLTLVKALLARGADPNARITTSAMIFGSLGFPKKGAFEPYSCGTGDLRGATPLWVASGDGGGGFVGGVRHESSVEIVRVLLAAGADQHLTTDDGTTPFMVAAGLGGATYMPRKPRGDRSPGAEEMVKVLLEAGADINAVNEADFTALHGAAFRGLNEVVQFLVEHGANINARDYKGRTPFRLAQGSKQTFQFQEWPETAELFKALGASTLLGILGTVWENLSDVPAEDHQR
jgi:ankyrin repeat protein